MEIKLFQNQDVDAVFNFEWSRLPDSMGDLEKEMKSWDQPWRKESLQHYASLGWSFLAEDDQGIQGYLLAQTFLFFNNWTQTVWVESFNFSSPGAGRQLIDTTLRWAKTKHMQKVVMNTKCPQFTFAAESFPDFKENQYAHYSTTKMSEPT